jgi:hypothetical protein
MQCREVENVLEQGGLTPLPPSARAHLAGCDTCQNLLADLTSIVEVAHKLPAEVNPPNHIWIALRAQLESEGIIKTPEAAAERTNWWSNIAASFWSRGLATAIVAMLIIAATALQLRPPSPRQEASNDPIFETAKVLNDQERGLPNMQLASMSTVDTSLRESLQTVNDFIADCERHVKQEPRDDLAREYLSGAYQQKADLLATMMERGGSGY